MAVNKVILNGSTIMDVSQDTVAADKLLSAFTATKNNGTKITGNIVGKSASNLTASGSTVTVPSGYYSSQVTKNISSGSVTVNGGGKTDSISLALTSSTGAINASYHFSSTIGATLTSGYVSSVSNGWIQIDAANTLQLTSLGATSYTPTTTSQTIPSYRWLTGTQTINAIPSAYIIPSGTSTITSNGTYSISEYASAVVSVPKMYDMTITSPYSVETQNYYQFVAINKSTNTRHYLNGSVVSFVPGESLYIFAQGMAYGGSIYVNGSLVSTKATGYASYIISSLPANDIAVSMSSGAYGEVWISDIEYIPKSELSEYIPKSELSRGYAYFLDANKSSVSFANITNVIGSVFGVGLGLTYQSYRSVIIDDPSAITAIGAYAFEGFTTGYSTALPSFINCATIGSGAFLGASFNGAMSFDFSNVTSIGAFAFMGAKGISSVSLPNITEIPSYAFANASIQSVCCPNITKIGAAAFGTCFTLSLSNTQPRSMYTIESGNIFIPVPWLNRSNMSSNILTCTMVHAKGGYLASLWNGTMNRNNISFASFSLAETVEQAAFFMNFNIKSVSLPVCRTIGAYAFAGCSNSYFTSIELPEALTLSVGAFAGCWHLVSCSFPKVSKIEGFIFAYLSVGHDGLVTGFGNYLSELTSVYFPSLELIDGNMVFTNCYGLSSLDFPSLLEISGDFVFWLCSNLVSISFPLLSKISGRTLFHGCVGLSSLDFPNLTECYTSYNNTSGIFYNQNIEYINLPKLSNVGFYQTSPFLFTNMSKLKRIELPELAFSSKNITYSMFSGCVELSWASFAKLQTMSSGIFSRCFNLVSLFVLASSVCTLGATAYQAFYSTPLSNYSTSAGRWGSVFVPASLLDSYKTATNWTTISSRIFAYEDYFDSNGNPL